MDNRFPIALRGSWFGINRRFRALLKGSPLTPVQYTVLRNLHECDGNRLNQQKLASRLSSNENNLSSILNRLESLGMIRKSSRMEDRRVKYVTLSSKGRNTFLEARKQANQLQMNIASEFSREEYRRLFLYLERCSQKMDSFPE